MKVRHLITKELVEFKKSHVIDVIPNRSKKCKPENLLDPELFHKGIYPIIHLTSLPRYIPVLPVSENKDNDRIAEAFTLKVRCTQ